ncbi:MAG TPA: hypothetical protein VMU05_18055 [Dongiaceae bacterium]|nr:hypothetical protein [Dongiaceae bacterium]
MATAPVSSSIHNGLQTYFQARSSDLQKLGQALQSGDMAAAEQEYKAIQDLGQSGPFGNGHPFKISGREEAFEAIGRALQSGDLAGAQQAFATLKSSFHHGQRVSPPNPDLGGPLTPIAPSAGQPQAASTSASAGVDVTA